jgi:hypothetical protein
VVGDAQPKAEHRLSLSLPLPDDLPSGRYVIPVDIKFGPWHMPQRAEAIIER